MATISPTQQKRLKIFEDDLLEVLEAVCSISPENIFNFGMKLGLNHSTIKTLQLQCTGDMKGWLREMLNDRLKQEPPLTWHNIVTALKSPLISEHHLARQIESHYIADSQPPSSVSQRDLSTAHTSTVPSSQHSLTADSVPLALAQPLLPTFKPQPPHSYPPYSPQWVPSHPPPHHSHYHPPYPPDQSSYQPQPMYFSTEFPRPSLHHHPLHYTASQLSSTQYPTYHPSSHPPLDHSHHQSFHPPTNYKPPELPTSHQPSTPYYPPHYLPPIKPPQAAGSTSSVSEETVPPTKIARLELPVRPHSALNEYQHIITDVGTTDSTSLVSQLRATQTTACPTPPNPLLTDDSSVSRQPSPMHTSPTPPLQSSTYPKSSKSDQPQATTVRSESLTVHQSRVVADVLTRYTSQLTEVFSNDLQYFSNRFIELGFIRRKAVSDIHTMVGIGSGGKAEKLLDLVIANCNTSRDKKTWFDIFVGVFSSEASYEDLATSMTEYFSRNCKDSSSSTAYAAHPSLDHSFQSHSPTTDRPSLSAEVGRSQVMSHRDPQSVHTQSQASSHIPSSHMQCFIEYVKTFYKGSVVERDPKVVKLWRMPTKVYINLVCIDRQCVENAREYDEVTEAMVREGSVDVVQGKKWKIEFDEIDAKLPSMSESSERVVLVEGAPGVGKSTFAWEFCRRWERGEIAQQYQLVLLLRLREERISNAKGLEDLIYHPSKDVRHTVNTELEHNLGINTLIILEGFDELPDDCRKGGSVFMNLIAGKLLCLATVLVTSRPWATRRIHLDCENQIYQHIEILGFTDCQITEYIESTLPQDKVSDLKAYLESHPQIRAGMYIPLNSAIVVTVYEESQASGYAMPATLTELYTSLARTLLLRYLRGHPEYETDDNIFLQTLNDLPQPVYAKFSEVCKLAYSGTVGTKHGVQLIYRKSKMPSEFNDLGFMDSVTELYVTRAEASSYNFLHLTFQEFFAAVHISNLSPAKQVEHFKRHKEDRLKVVLRFLAGLNKLNCFSNEEIANNFFQIPSISEGSRYQMSCDATIGIDFVQWLFEAQSDYVIEHVLGQKTIEFQLSSGMLPLDYYSLGYCISHSQCQWVLGLGKKIGETEVRMLAAGAGTRSEPSGRVVGLKGKSREQGRSQMNEKKPPLSMSRKCLNVLFTKWNSILHLHQLSLELPVPCDDITWPDLSSLQVLVLIIKRAHKKWKIKTLLRHRSLESLTLLCDNGFVIEDGVAIGDHVKSSTRLKELCFSSNRDKIYKKDEKAVEAITAALASNQSLPLERLELECKCTFTATAVDSLTQFITNTTTLQYLSIRRCTFSVHALLVLARAIHHNSILQTKNVEDFNLEVNGDNEAKELLVKYPDVGYNSMIMGVVKSISDAGAVALAQFLRGNSTLTELNLSGNDGIGEEGTHQLVQALTVNKSILCLRLPKKCKEYATQCPQYHTVKDKIRFKN